MDELLLAPQEKEITLFYSLIRQHPDFLRAIDQKQFADTPLHQAAKAGRTQLALEIQRLMPSFGSKLNHDGFSPVDLALQEGHTETIRAMIRLNPELVSVQGREGMTPLHYVAENDNDELLAEFLLSCPDSIEKLTVREETAVHVAVRNGRVNAFGVLFGWLKRTNRTEVLRWCDWEGNTVLHLAAFTNQPQVLGLLIKEVRVNHLNLKGLTALDIVMELPPEVFNGQARQILLRNKARNGAAIRRPRVAGYLRARANIGQRTLKCVAHLERGVPSDLRSAILVVAILIVNATYRELFSLPGGLSDQTLSRNITSNIGFDVLKIQELAGSGKKSVRENEAMYVLLNSIALAASLGTIVSLLPVRSYNILLHLSLIFLMISSIYLTLAENLQPFSKEKSYVMMVCYLISYVILSLKTATFLGMYMLNKRASRRFMATNNADDIKNELAKLTYMSQSSRSYFDG